MKLRDLLNEGLNKVKIEGLNFEEHSKNNMIRVPQPNSDKEVGFYKFNAVKDLEDWKKMMKRKYKVKYVFIDSSGKVTVDNKKFNKERADYAQKKFDALNGLKGWGSH